MVKAIVDTTIIVDLLRNYGLALQWYQTQQPGDLAINPIVWMEVIAGGPTKVKRLQSARLLQRFTMIVLSDDDQRWAMRMQMQYELSHGVQMTDCLIASTSRLGIPLYTRNLKHFTPALGRLAISPY